MAVKGILVKTQLKLHLSNIFFFLLNILHILVAATSKISVKTEGFLRFSIIPFQQFNVGAFVIAIVIFVIQLLISYIILLRKFKTSGLTQINELGIIGENNEKILTNLRIDPKQIFTWVHELAEEQNIKSIKRIYLTDTSIPNAMTMDVVPIPGIRSTWIVLDANVLEILDEREIKAVISHELGHVKYFDAIVNLYRFGINFFVYIAYSLIVLTLLYRISEVIIEGTSTPLGIALKIAFFIVVILILWALTIINRLLMSFSRRHAEFMADYYAAKKVGRDHIINALVILGQRLDVVTSFATEVKWLGSLEGKDDMTREFVQGIKDLPSKELSKEISREKAVKTYIYQRLKNLRDDLFIPITDEQIDEFTKIASEKLLKKRGDLIQKGTAPDRKLQEEMVKLTIDWLLIDKDKDLYLNEDEIEQLVTKLLLNPNKELFEQDIMQRRSIFGTEHPSMRDRIIFLYYASKNLKDS
ncbi:MAG: M48 family metallopeptidase [Candidatus Heimdallarchaeota archaeon]